MIKIGILGAETPAAGELIRILINHPDVVLTTLASSQIAPGTRIDTIHRGLVGDTDLTISPSLSPEGLSAVMLCGEPWEARRWMETHASHPDMEELRIIDLTGAFHNGEADMIYGLPEHNRKPLVRGARRASIPSPVTMAIVLALFPLAKAMLLPAGIPVKATVTLPPPAHSRIADFPGHTDTIGTSTRLDPIAPADHRPDHETFAAETAAELSAIQPALNPALYLSIALDPALRRGLTATIDIPFSQSLGELIQRYHDTFEDHNFTYIIDRHPSVDDVENTNKCLIHLSYPTADPDGYNPVGTTPTLRITVTLDSLLKGSAGNAVHVLNLLFGLSERTGLALKASAI